MERRREEELAAQAPGVVLLRDSGVSGGGSPLPTLLWLLRRLHNINSLFLLCRSGGCLRMTASCCCRVRLPGEDFMWSPPLLSPAARAGTWRNQPANTEGRSARQGRVPLSTRCARRQSTDTPSRTGCVAARPPASPSRGEVQLPPYPRRPRALRHPKAETACLVRGQQSSLRRGIRVAGHHAV